MVIKRGDMFYADLSPVIGSEQGGIRPVLIIQNDTGNKYSTTTVGIPLTSKRSKRNLPTHKVLKNYGKLIDESTVLAEQICTIDKSQIINYICDIREEDLKEINKKIAISLALEN